MKLGLGVKASGHCLTAVGRLGPHIDINIIIKGVRICVPIVLLKSCTRTEDKYGPELGSEAYGSIHTAHFSASKEQLIAWSRSGFGMRN